MASSDDASLELACPRCLASVQIPSLLAGKQCRCPHCQLVFDVPKLARTAAGGEESPVDADARPPVAGLATYIPVVCPLCHTRMYGTIEQVGQTLKCPDCGRTSVVPPPRPAAKAIAVPATVDVYPLASEVEPTAGVVRASEQSYVAVICQRCQTRLTATLDQVGDTLLCPDCGMANVVPAPPARPHSLTNAAGTVYGLAKASPEETPPLAVEEAPRPIRDWRLQPQSERPVLPRGPFITGTFSFPFFSGTLLRVLVLTAWSLLADGLLMKAIQLGGVNTPYTWLFSALLGTATLIVTVMWFAFASACALLVVRETASGCNKISEWPGISFFDWFLDPLYLFYSLCVSFMPGAGVAWCLAQLGWTVPGVPLVSLFFLFPVVLLSTLEKDSPLAVFSWPVVRSVWTAWQGWAGFFVATVALFVAAGNVLLAVRPGGDFWVVMVASPVFIIVWFIYFRLLGRLAWYCAEHGEAEADADAGESPDEESLDEEDPAEAE
jgi:DNA-directed RNA polymerase subunit RPC12/RpoP